jgi:hypothetical protein
MKLSVAANFILVRTVVVVAALLFVASRVQAWDYAAHRAINELALAALPTNFPAFTRTAAARDRIGFLAGEADRWRNSPEMALSHASGPDHYLDWEQLADYGLTAATVAPFRYDFAVQLGLARAAHPEKFEPINPDKNKDHTRELVGFLPWRMTEDYARLKSGFSYQKTFQQHGGTKEEIANAEANIIYVMGVMGHFVGDASQPLHATKHHHGWVGANPENYPTNSRFHSWIDGGYIQKSGGLDVAALTAKLKPPQPVGNPAVADSFFRAMMDYVAASNRQVEPLYKLERDRKLSPRDGVVDAEGREFIERRILVGAEMLAGIWLAAWQDAPEDKFLRTELEKRLKVGDGGK